MTLQAKILRILTYKFLRQECLQYFLTQSKILQENKIRNFLFYRSFIEMTMDPYNFKEITNPFSIQKKQKNSISLEDNNNQNR